MTTCTARTSSGIGSPLRPLRPPILGWNTVCPSVTDSLAPWSWAKSGQTSCNSTRRPYGPVAPPRRSAGHTRTSVASAWTTWTAAAAPTGRTPCGTTAAGSTSRRPRPPCAMLRPTVRSSIAANTSPAIPTACWPSVCRPRSRGGSVCASGWTTPQAMCPQSTVTAPPASAGGSPRWGMPPVCAWCRWADR